MGEHWRLDHLIFLGEQRQALDESNHLVVTGTITSIASSSSCGRILLYCKDMLFYLFMSLYDKATFTVPSTAHGKGQVEINERLRLSGGD
jgi:hypothetical protein